MTDHTTKNTTTQSTLVNRFWKYVEKTNDCWLWTGAKTHGGYGVLNNGAKVIRAHRLSYQIHRGDFSPDLDILHKCDNPSCVNPDHLSTGTAKDNVADMFQKGRGYVVGGASGEKHPGAKLTQSQVDAIRSEYIPHVMSFQKLADKYGVSKRAIQFIVHRKQWI